MPRFVTILRAGYTLHRNRDWAAGGSWGGGGVLGGQDSGKFGKRTGNRNSTCSVYEIWIQ